MCRQCGFSGCKDKAVWSCRKLWGEGGTLLTCDAHKPDPKTRPASLRHLPFFYEVSRVWTCPVCEQSDCDGYCSVDRFDGGGGFDR
jgi:hypothetical protein